MNRVALVFFLWALLTFNVEAQESTQQRIKIGVPTALSGSAAAFGNDIKNALTLMNEKHGNGKYDLIFEDEQCDNRVAVSVAQKLINIDKIKYALGFGCNSTLLATASIYSRAKVVVVTSSATSGDVENIGKGIFRLFPSDVAGADLLFKYMAARHKRIGILTEQNEYPVMMERSVRKANERAGKPIELSSEEFVHGESDFRTLLLRLTKSNIDGLFINANTDDSFISVVKQIRASKFNGALYAVYLPASDTARKALGSALNGFVFSNLPLADELVTDSGKELLSDFRKRFGEPQSGFPVVPISFEAFRIFDLALSSGKEPVEFLASTKFAGGFVPSFHFDEHGAVQGINFQMQKVENDKVVLIKD
jgi:branched-chain amino acid transport system substrate-binding protein